MAILNSLSAAMLHTSSTVSTELCDPLAQLPIEYYIQEYEAQLARIESKSDQLAE